MYRNFKFFVLFSVMKKAICPEIAPVEEEEAINALM